MGGANVGGPVTPNKVIVVIDDEIRVFRTLRTLVEGHRLPYDVIYSPDIEDALGMIAEMRDFANIAMFVVDCCMDNSNVPNTMLIVDEIRDRGFEGPILAQSGDVRNTMPLLSRGASLGCDKFNIFPKLKELLRLI